MMPVRFIQQDLAEEDAAAFALAPTLLSEQSRAFLGT
jgi:hypothetical protein